MRVEHKDGGEVVTRADREADALIRAGLTDAFPDDVVYSEEAPDPPARHHRGRIWIVDPLDATGSFVRGGDDYSVSIGLALFGEAAAGAVYVPDRDELYLGARGRGVRLNDELVRVTARTSLAARRITGSPKELAALREALGIAVEPLSSMAHKLARVAAGRDDAAVSLKPRKEWGTCAGVALVRAGGGRVPLRDGQPIAFNRVRAAAGPGLIAARRDLHELLLEKVNRADGGEGA